MSLRNRIQLASDGITGADEKTPRDKVASPVATVIYTARDKVLRQKSGDKLSAKELARILASR